MELRNVVTADCPPHNQTVTITETYSLVGTGKSYKKSYTNYPFI